MPWDLACERNWLSAEQLALTARQKSAEGIVGERGLLAEGPNGSPKGVEREEKLLAASPWGASLVAGMKPTLVRLEETLRLGCTGGLLCALT